MLQTNKYSSVIVIAICPNSTRVGLSVCVPSEICCLMSLYFLTLEAAEKLKIFLTPPQFSKSQPALSPRPCLAFTSFESALLSEIILTIANISISRVCPSPLAGEGYFSMRGTSVRQRKPPKNEASDPVLRKGKIG